jgi:hypothetical protein
MNAPKLLAMFAVQPPIQGDEALLRLAAARLTQAGLGGEMYPASPEHLRALLPLRPAGLPCTAHLPRNCNLLEETGRESILAYARIASGALYGVLVHDHLAFGADVQGTVRAFRALDRALACIPDAPLLFVEFAAGLEPEQFAGLFEESRDLQRVCPAIDVSHVAIHLCRTLYARDYPGEEVCALRPDSPGLAGRLDAVQAVAAQARAGAVGLTARLARLGTPLHFHLHDGHPLSIHSQFGVSDHLSFLQQIVLPFPYRGRHGVAGVFGIGGLRELVTAALAIPPAGRVSFMIEVHPQEGRSPLHEHRELFGAWSDLANAERMNYWLDRLVDNATLLRDACGLARLA